WAKHEVVPQPLVGGLRRLHRARQPVQRHARRRTYGFAPEVEDPRVAADLAADGRPAIDADPELVSVIAVLEEGQAMIANRQRDIRDKQGPGPIGCAEAGGADDFLANDLEVRDVLL